MIAALCAAQSANALADTLVLNDSLLHGRVLAVGETTIEFSPGCRGKTTVAKTAVKHISYNTSCKPRPLRPYSAGGEICAAPQLLEELEFANPERHIFVSDYQLSANRIHLVMPNGSSIAHGPRTGLVGATRRLVCPSPAINNVAPMGFCAEERQWAVNFSYKQIISNAILTQGMSFYLVDENGKPLGRDHPMASVIRDAFGSAMTKWMAALQDHQAQLPQQAKDAIHAMESRGQRYTLLTPPQVIQLGCPDNASFVVGFASTSERNLVNTDGSDPKAARAQVEGRTLLINGVRYKCWQSVLEEKLLLAPDPATGGPCQNLLPVMIHELGHAFGLRGHVDDRFHPSIMDSVIREGVTSPTPADADALAAILIKPIKGAPAGRLDADGRGVSIEKRRR